MPVGLTVPPASMIERPKSSPDDFNSPSAPNSPALPLRPAEHHHLGEILPLT